MYVRSSEVSETKEKFATQRPKRENTKNSEPFQFLRFHHSIKFPLPHINHPAPPERQPTLKLL